MAKGAPGAAPLAAPDAGAVYEYLTFYIGTGSTHGDLAIAKLNELGAQGWLLQVAGMDTLYFSRVVVPPPPSDPPVNVDVPSIQPETANVGDALTVTTGNWNNEPTSYSYQWVRDSYQLVRDSEQPGSGPTNTYNVTADDAGHSITCVVTATNVAGSTAAPPSNAVVIP
jgi:hypothetical protein